MEKAGRDKSGFLHAVPKVATISLCLTKANKFHAHLTLLLSPTEADCLYSQRFSLYTRSKHAGVKCCNHRAGAD